MSVMFSSIVCAEVEVGTEGSWNKANEAISLRHLHCAADIIVSSANTLLKCAELEGDAEGELEQGRWLREGALLLDRGGHASLNTTCQAAARRYIQGLLARRCRVSLSPHLRASHLRIPHLTCSYANQHAQSFTLQDWTCCACT